MERDGSIQDPRREISDRRDLAARKPGGSKLSGRDSQDGLGGEITLQQCDKSSMDRTRRGTCQLLMENTLGEGGKVAGGPTR